MSLPDLTTLRAVANWQQWWPDDASAALDDARARLPAAVEAWELRDPCPLGDGEVAVVFAARSRGRDVVVKVNPRVPGHTDELDDEDAGLAFWAPTGAVVTLLCSRDGGATMLLERLRPGMTLHDANPGESATLQTLGALAGRLHAAGLPPTGEFAQLGESSLGHDLAATLRDRPEAAELSELLRTDTSDALIHADLHSLNALQTDGAFKAIDPKPHLADRHADIFGLLSGRHVALPEGRRDARALATERVARYAKAAGLDADRARAWTRVRARSIEQWVAAMTQPSDEDLRWAREVGRVADVLR